MKKKLRIPLIIAACLAVFCLGFLLAGMTVPRSFYKLPRGRGSVPPAQASGTVTIVLEGTYPGFSDTPVTAEQAAPGRRVMYALRAQKYTWGFPLLRPRNDGLAICEMTGCTPEYIAYWDGRYLWLPNERGTWWHSYAPSSPKELDEALRTAKR